MNTQYKWLALMKVKVLYIHMWTIYVIMYAMGVTFYFIYIVALYIIVYWQCN